MTRVHCMTVQEPANNGKNGSNKKKTLAKDPVTGKIWKSPGTNLTPEEQLELPKFMCYYQLGETTPYYIETMGWEKTVGRLKERILETRGKRGTAANLTGVKDISMYKIYPPGKDKNTGLPIHPELDDMEALIPTNSSFEDPILVPAVTDTEQEAASAANVQELVRQRMLARKKAKAAKNASTTPTPTPTSTDITVQVRTPDGKTIPVTLNPKNDNILAIKEKIGPQVNMPVADQVLTFNQQELTNANTPEDSGLKEGSVIHLQPNTITVQVKTHNGELIPVTLNPTTDSLRTIKEHVAPHVGIDPSNQVLSYNNTKLTNDEETVKAMGLENGSVIDLAPGDITVHVKTPCGKTISVTTNPTNNIQSIKQAIADEAGVEPSQQRLTFNDTELPSNNEETLEAMGLEDGSILQLLPNTITVHVKTPDGSTIPVTIQPSDDILSIKHAIASEADVEPSKQVLSLDGTELVNGDSAETAGLQDGSIIHLAPGTITVQVRTPDGNVIPVTIDDPANTTIQTIKKRIAPDVGVDPSKQVLSFDGNELPDGKSAEATGLQDGSFIDLAPNTITVHVKTPDGKLIPVTMAPSDSMDFVKEKVAPEAGIEPERQVLSFDGNNLSGNETADSVGLKDGSVIDLAPNTITSMSRLRTAH
ncbi:Polyubiquitin (Fragment) [Seminavis robusta]|uniref:Polyubiquitin n=1 Tax=Seminavis robusta TaxID=568900 RepID=A0A9N8H5Q3_9STRA